jgi:hypothetical protein
MTDLSALVIELRRAIASGEFALAEAIASQLADLKDIPDDDERGEEVGIWGADG